MCVDFGYFLDPEAGLALLVGALDRLEEPMGYHLDVIWLTWEATGVTLEANRLHVGSPWGDIGVIWGSLDSILSSCGC